MIMPGKNDTFLTVIPMDETEKETDFRIMTWDSEIHLADLPSLFGPV